MSEKMTAEALLDLADNVYNNGDVEDFLALNTALESVCRERDEAQKHFRQICEDTSTDMECLPGCDSISHEALCPVTNTQEAWRRMKAEVVELRAALEAVLHDVGYLTGKDRCFECGINGKTIGNARAALTKGEK